MRITTSRIVPAAIAILAATAALPAVAADQPDPMAASRRVDEAIKALEEKTPVAQKVKALGEQMDALHKESEKQMTPLQNQQNDLYNSAAYQAFSKNYNALEEQREDAWEIERKAMAAAARDIYAARHAELQKLAPAAIPHGLALGFDVLTYPQIDGSTTMEPLSVIIASRLLNVPYEWLYPEPSGSPWANHARASEHLFLPDRGMPGAADYINPRDMQFSIAASQLLATPPAKATTAQQRLAMVINSLLAAGSNTHQAYVNLIEGKCDLNLNARLPSASEIKLAKDKGVKLVAQPIAMDALVFMVNHTNPVHNLTLQQVRDIYLGKTTRWQDLADAKALAGWRVAAENGKNIVAFRRDPDSGSRELFDTLVMQGKPVDDKNLNNDLYGYSMAGPYNQLTQRQAGIAYSVYYYEHFMALSPYTHLLAIDGIKPTAQTIATKKYPLTSPVYAVYRESDPPDSPGRKFAAWLLSDEGQSVIRESGYVTAK